MTKITVTVTIDKERIEGREPRVYFFHQGEEVGHNLKWRHWRPAQLYFGILPTILRYAGTSVTEQEVNEPTTLGRWDQFAACCCGCAPMIALNREGPEDLYVTIAVESEGARTRA